MLLITMIFSKIDCNCLVLCLCQRQIYSPTKYMALGYEGALNTSSGLAWIFSITHQSCIPPLVSPQQQWLSVPETLVRTNMLITVPPMEMTALL